MQMSEQYKMPEQQKLTNYQKMYQTWNAKLQISRVPKCHNHHRNKAGCHLIHQLESIDKDIQGSQVTSNSDVLCNLLNAKIFNSFNYSLFFCSTFQLQSCIQNFVTCEALQSYEIMHESSIYSLRKQNLAHFPIRQNKNCTDNHSKPLLSSEQRKRYIYIEE